MENTQLFSQLREATVKACAKMGVPLQDERFEALYSYVEELSRWNKAYNLVGRKMGIEGMIGLCVDALSPLGIKGLFDEGKEVLDIGSGAGMPGVPLYIVAGPFKLTLVESQRKKITFLRHIRRKLGLTNISIYPGRLEAMCREEDFLNNYETALARAVADPARIIKLAQPLLCENGQLVVFVGEKDADELRRSSALLESRGFKIMAIRSTKRITQKDNYLVQLAKIQQRGPEAKRTPVGVRAKIAR